MGDPPPRRQEPGGLAAARWRDSNSTARVFAGRGQAAIGPATWVKYLRAAPARCGQLARMRSTCPPPGEPALLVTYNPSLPTVMPPGMVSFPGARVICRFVPSRDTA